MAKVWILELKPYVYETVNGKRKRVNPLVVEGDTVVKIIPRGIVNKCQIEKK